MLWECRNVLKFLAGNPLGLLGNSTRECEHNINGVSSGYTIERNADVLLNACKDIGLAVNTGKTKYMEIGRHRGMIANEHINSYEKVKTFKFLGSY